ncbi:hypothetical protein [Corallococcus macrosporus]|uniref:Uncharacterized protein n=1 Tax=Corallococcus macrosporus DSM 14697 TaxID=1189310 RepID=A0A250JVD8_9BACT|nr:hypothetical protein [Corallococcus macrosporus]ATB47590.1 hypothetical protein MYMAC_003206 [Corallococcus macrosporus DSM 14697]
MARIPLTASVALATPGGRNRNRLRPSSHGVADFRLRSPGGPQSRCHRPAPCPVLAGGDDGFHFAPDAEPVELSWRVLDTTGRARAGKLELFTRHRKAPLWSRDLSPEELLQGEHHWRWDGRVPASEAFPDGVVTVEHSPYKLKLTLQGSGLAQAPVAWTYFHVLVAGVELELGDPQVLARQQNRELTQAMKQLPAPGEKAELRLVGNVFKTKPLEMFDDTDFQLHRKHWGSGPELPLFARAWVKDSRGNRVDAPKALGRVRFLWDWEDETEAIEHHAPAARAFLKHALNRHCATSQPQGDNAHRDVGGKRGAPSSAVFPRQAGYAPRDTPRDGVFPFRVTPCNKRGWAAYSQAWTTGAFAGRTGVVFQPSSIAGDAWRVTVQLAYDRRKDGGVVLDVEDAAPLPAAVRASTGVFQSWREVHLSRLMRKDAGVSGFSLSTVQDCFERAYLRLEDRTGGVSGWSARDYNARIAQAVAASRHWELRAAIDPAVDQFTANSEAITFRGYPEFLDEVAHVKRCADADLPRWLAPTRERRRSLLTARDYHRQCKDWAKELLTQALDSALGEAPGIALFQFSGLYNLETSVDGIRVNGFASEFPSRKRDRCAVIQCAAEGNYQGTHNTLEQTLAHEVGHQLFLPHAPFPEHRKIGGALALRHDRDGKDCLMGYDFTSERRFCGLCLLRLRGWNTHALNHDGARNARP